MRYYSNEPESVSMRRTTFQGKGLLNSTINKLPFELHLPGYNYCGPGTKLEKRLQRGDRGINPLDEACKSHDIAYSKYKDLANRHDADRILLRHALSRINASDASWKEKLAAAGVSAAMHSKVKLGMGSNSGGIYPKNIINLSQSYNRNQGKKTLNQGFKIMNQSVKTMRDYVKKIEILLNKIDCEKKVKGQNNKKSCVNRKQTKKEPKKPVENNIDNYHEKKIKEKIKSAVNEDDNVNEFENRMILDDEIEQDLQQHKSFKRKVDANESDGITNKKKLKMEKISTNQSNKRKLSEDDDFDKEFANALSKKIKY